MFVHLTSPKLDFLDRGKARVALPAAVAGQIIGLVDARHQEVDEAEAGRDPRAQCVLAARGRDGPGATSR